MLRTLRIRNLVIVEDLTIELGPGLNVVTGETGAGKSILVDAMGLILGARSERELVRAGEKRAIVEAAFDPPGGTELREWAASRGLLEVDDEEQILIRREVQASGGGRVFVNGSPATLSMLRELAPRLLEIHGQPEQPTRSVLEGQLRIVDRLGGHGSKLQQVGAAFARVTAARRHRAELEQQASERSEAVARRKAKVREIEAVSPRPGELDELDRERNILRHGERMAGLLSESVSLAYDGEPAAASLAASAARKAEELAELDPSLLEVAQRLRAAAVDIQDAGAALRDYRDSTNFDPGRLGEVEARRAALEDLLLRHGPDERAALDHLEQLRGELARLGDLEQETEAAGTAVLTAEEAYLQAAGELRAAREAAAKRLRPAVEKQFKALALERARFEVVLVAARTAEDVARGEASWALSRRGAERAEFRFAANPGEPSRELSKVASGGELSRIMLALHVVADDESRRTLVFDEVDTGVGGAVADAVGSRLSRLARRRQVLCVTHLPQVAAYGETHFRVDKRVAGGRTQAGANRLSNQGRVDEVARMLAGREPTPASRRHAADLLRAAGAGRETSKVRSEA